MNLGYFIYDSGVKKKTDKLVKKMTLLSKFYIKMR